MALLDKETAEMVAGKPQGPWRNEENLLEFLVITVMMDVMMCGDISFIRGEIFEGNSVSIILHLRAT